MGLIGSVGQQLRLVWRSLSGGYRVILVLLVIVCVGAAAAVMSWGGTTHYQVLATDLPAEECASLCSALTDAGIPARVNEQGNSVLVASARLAEARMVAAKKGVRAKEDSGFDFFKKPPFAMTTDSQRIMYTSVLQNELARTIASMDPVAQARVHLVMPDKRLFKGDQAPPTAGVLVVTKANRRLSAANAAAIANLVAGAVEGLAVEDVTITDEAGRVITGPSEDAAEVVAADRLAYQQQVEAHLTGQTEAMLARVLGPGKYVVRVCADLEFEDYTMVQKTYDPNPVKAREKIETVSESGGGMATGGVTGAAAAIPAEAEGATAMTPALAPRKMDKELIDTEWMVSGSVREQVMRGASIKKLNIAAFVDLSPPAPQAEGTEGETPSPRLTVEDVSAIIKDAVGFTETAERADSLKVVEVAFQPAEAAVGPPGLLDRYGWLGKWVALSMLGLVMLFIARRAFGTIASAVPPKALVPEVMGVGEGEGFPGGVSADELLRREVSRFVEGSPEVAGRLVEGWLEGEE
jgi:flagellar M-ring protein FliF